MHKSFRTTLAMAKKEAVDMRSAAYLVAVHRVADAAAVRGLCS
jgi:glutamate dehydrogenase/leucine dehydrogenase